MYPEDTVTAPPPGAAGSCVSVCNRGPHSGSLGGWGDGKGRREYGAGTGGDSAHLSLRKPSPGITRPPRLGLLSGQTPALACPLQTTSHPPTHCLLPLSWAPVEPGWMCPQCNCGGTSVNLDELSGPSLCLWATSPVKTRFTLHSLGPREHHPQRSDRDGGLGSCSTSTTLNNLLDSETPALTLLSAHWPLPLMLGHFCLWRRNAILDRPPAPRSHPQCPQGFALLRRALLYTRGSAGNPRAIPKASPLGEPCSPSPGEWAPGATDPLARWGN